MRRQISSPLDYLPKSGIAGSHGNSASDFGKYHQIIFQSSHTVLQPRQRRDDGRRSSTPLPTLTTVTFVLFCSVSLPPPTPLANSLF